MHSNVMSYTVLLCHHRTVRNSLSIPLCACGWIDKDLETNKTINQPQKSTSCGRHKITSNNVHQALMSSSGNLFCFLFFRAQSYYCGPGQRWQDHHSLPIVSAQTVLESSHVYLSIKKRPFCPFLKQLDEWGGTHLAYDREQCGRDCGQQHPFPDVGHWGPGVPQVLLEYVLHKHRGNRWLWGFVFKELINK